MSMTAANYMRESFEIEIETIGKDSATTIGGLYQFGLGVAQSLETYVKTGTSTPKKIEEAMKSVEEYINQTLGTTSQSDLDTINKNVREEF